MPKKKRRCKHPYKEWHPKEGLIDKPCPHPYFGRGVNGHTGEEIDCCIFHASIETKKDRVEQFWDEFEGIFARTKRAAEAAGTEEEKKNLWLECSGFVFPDKGETFKGREFPFSLNMVDTQFPGVADFRGAKFLGNAYFLGAKLSGGAYFVNGQFTSDAVFEKVQFSGVAVFLCARFSGIASFHRATFSGVAVFVRASFSGIASFHGATLSGETNFFQTTFSGNASLRYAKFSGGAVFEEVIFKRTANFNNVTFKREGRFEKAIFEDSADFTEASFGEPKNRYGAYFRGAEFNRNVYFDTTKFWGFAVFSNVRLGKREFRPTISFQYVEFHDKVYFNDTEFWGITSFFNVTFSGLTDFNKAKFFRSVSFGGNIEFGKGVEFRNALSLKRTTVGFVNATFKSIVDFSNAEFRGNLGFIETDLEKDVEFAHTKLSGGLSLWNSRFKGKTSFFGAKFTNTEISDTYFEGDTCFHSTEFKKSNKFIRGGFYKNVKLTNTQISGYLIFFETQFLKATDLRGIITEQKRTKRGCIILKYCRFHNPALVLIGGEGKPLDEEQHYPTNLTRWSFRGTNIEAVQFIPPCWDSDLKGRKKVFDELLAGVGEREKVMKEYNALSRDDIFGVSYEEAASVYRRLRLNYENKLDYHTAGDFHVGEMECRRRGASRGILDWLFIRAYRIISGYGESVGRPLWWLLVFFALFTGLFLVWTGFPATDGSAVDWAWGFKGMFSCGWWGELWQGISFTLRSSASFAVPRYAENVNAKVGATLPALMFFWKVFAVTIVTFFVLALRRRFRR
jgi:uncharacterized protein YjbI with pentapeptide repeats